MRKRIPALILVFCLAASLAGCGTSGLNAVTPRRVIIDTDTAGDDALAIALTAKAPNITLEGVCVLAGNVPVEQGLKNALMTLEMAGRPDVPVFPGADSTIDGTERVCFSVFGSDGMGDCGLIHPEGQAQEKDAVDFILDTVRANPGEIEILAIGPATDIALAIQKEPETMEKVKRIWSMGTAGFGEGNATPVAEFNVYNDAKAYRIMMESGIPVTVVGLDMCELDSVLYHPADMASLAKSSELGNFLTQSWGKLYEFKKEYQNSDYVDICDGVAASALIWDNFITSSVNCSSYVQTDDNPAFGQVIFYREGFTYDSMPQVTGFDKTVVTAISEAAFRPSVMLLLK